MASIVKKVKKGRAYYYAVESGRVNGKPRIVWQKYLGTVDAIVEQARSTTPPRPQETVIFEAGGVAALLGIAQRLGLVELIDEGVAKRDQGPSVGQYMVLAALNRALAPCSKLQIGQWYEGTVLRRLWRFRASLFSSQRYWDHMGMVSEEAIEEVQDRLVPRIEREFGIDARILLYDTTNFFTFLATSNTRARLAQRGHSKGKRNDLRQVGLALVVTREYQVPLFHRTYPGNVPDVSLFPKLSEELIARYRTVARGCDEATLVFDKGNVSEEVMERLTLSGTHFVAALGAHRFREVVATPLEQFEEVAEFAGTRAFSTEADLWGSRCRILVVYTESFFTQQLSGVTQNLIACQKNLQELARRLARRHRGTRPSVHSVQKIVREILAAQFMKELFRVAVEDDEGLPRLRYALDHAALEKLTSERLGKTILVTDHLRWSPADIISAYRNLASIEDAFKHMKNTHYLHWQPAYHWTDQKLRVHAFYCVLALLLTTLARKVAAESGIDLSVPALLNELTAIHEVAIVYPEQTPAHRTHQITLTRMSPRQRKLAECLELAKTLGR
jgi:transposase